MVRWIRLTAVLVALALWGPARADLTMTYIYYRDVGDIELRNQYFWRMLQAALEQTRDRWGDYVLEPSIGMNEKRRIHVLENNERSINVSMFPSQRGLDDKLVPVRIPIDRGMLGYRVFLIRQSEQPQFDTVKSLEDLKKFSFGLLDGWEDVPIMRSAGFTVIAGSSYEGLFKMLSAGRFDAFNRSSNEVVQEYDVRKKDLPGVVIEKHLLLHYTMPAYFWFPNTEEGRNRAERVRTGLAEMIQNGRFQALFDQEFGQIIKRLDMDHRMVIELPNPLLGEEDPLADPALWYRPADHAAPR